MTETTLDALEKRINLLERGLWKWKAAVAVVGIALMAIAGMVGVTSFQQQRKQTSREGVGEIAARKFVVVNEAGEAIATLGSLGDGAIVGLYLMPSRSVAPKTKEDKEIEKGLKEALQMLAETGGSVFGASREGSEISLSARRTPPDVVPSFGAQISADRERASLDLKTRADSAGKAAEISLATWAGLGIPALDDRATASVSSRSGRTVSLEASDAYQSGKYEAPGKASVTLSEPFRDVPRKFIPSRQAEFALSSDGSANLDFLAENYRTQGGLEVDKDGNPDLDLFDNEGKLRAALGVTDLQITRTGASEKTAPSSLTLFDKEGKVVWQSPQ